MSAVGQVEERNPADRWEKARFPQGTNPAFYEGLPKELVQILVRSSRDLT